MENITNFEPQTQTPIISQIPTPPQKNIFKPLFFIILGLFLISIIIAGTFFITKNKYSTPIITQEIIPTITNNKDLNSVAQDLYKAKLEKLKNNSPDEKITDYSFTVSNIVPLKENNFCFTVDYSLKPFNPKSSNWYAYNGVETPEGWISKITRFVKANFINGKYELGDEFSGPPCEVIAN